MSIQVEKKVVFVGDAGVGKSTLLKKILTNDFVPKYIPTLGVEVHKFKQYNIWDTAGQERFGGLRNGYYLGVNYGCVFVDTSSLLSIKNMVFWYKEILKYAPQEKIIIIATKTDIPVKQINMDTLKKLAEEINVCVHYISNKFIIAKEFEEILNNL
jgi:GTP-binding nuclear protein Ran